VCRAGEADRFKAVTGGLKADRDSATNGDIVQDTVLDVGSLRSNNVTQHTHYTA
jgi:hypothetical protein